MTTTTERVTETERDWIVFCRSIGKTYTEISESLGGKRTTEHIESFCINSATEESITEARTLHSNRARKVFPAYVGLSLLGKHGKLYHRRFPRVCGVEPSSILVKSPARTSPLTCGDRLVPLLQGLVYHLVSAFVSQRTDSHASTSNHHRNHLCL